MKKYLKAFILLPLIIQIIGTIGLMFANNDADGFQSSAITVFIVAAVPTFLIALWAAFHRYASYHVKGIALISVLIGHLMKKYLKAFILFPLIIQIIGTVALTFSNNDTDQIQSSVLSVFIVAAVPTFLITLWAAFHRYASYNVKAIALIAGLIGFSYTVVAGFFYATLVNDMGFGEWLRAGGLEITCLMAAGLALYSVMVLPLLLPKERPL